jgi:multidrug efflux system membrane fusion protein
MSQNLSMPSGRGRYRVVLWIFVILLACLAAWVIFRPSAPGHDAASQGGRGGGGRGARSVVSTATPVKVADAVVQDVPIYLGALGTVSAYNTVTVKSQVGGVLQNVYFTEGQSVRAGDRLAQIDPRPFQVALEQAQGTQLQNLALLENARRDLKRYQTLFKQDSIASQQMDTQAALVRQYEGTIKTDQAAIDSARLQVEYARITAPLSGRLGLKQVDQGNLIATGATTGIVVITQTQPIAVIFTIPETQLPDVLAEVRAGKTLSVDAYDRAGTHLVASGKLETLDNQIDVSTGTLKLKARFANTDETLFPNQFVNVQLHVQTRSGATAIPTLAVQQGTSGSYVFVARADNTVEVRPVQLGPIYKDMVAVNKGVAVGEKVVIEGTDRLRAGSKIDVITIDPLNPAAAPAGGGAAASSSAGAVAPNATASAPAGAPAADSRRRPRQEADVPGAAPVAPTAVPATRQP